MISNGEDTLKQRKLYLFLSLATAALMITIFCFSSQTGPESTDLSMGIVRKFLKLLSIEENTENLRIANFLVRKAAHLTLYFLLGCGLSGLLSISGRMSRRSVSVLAVILGAGFAATDEFHQSFTARTASIKDVLLDTCGVALGVLLILLLRNRLSKRQTKDEKREIGE